MKKIMISAVLLAGTVFTTFAQSNYNPRFPQCPEIANQGTQSLAFTGVVVGLGGKGPNNNIVDVELLGKVRVKAVCQKTKGNPERAEAKEFFRPFKSPRLPRTIFETEVNGGAVNFRHETERLTFTEQDAELYCPSKGKNWAIVDYTVFLSQWKLNIYSYLYGAATVEGTVQEELCPNYNPRME